jgi:transcriptional regulator of heat shock response
MNKPPTPRTDASRIFINITPDPNANPVEFVDASICETIERELAKANKILKQTLNQLPVGNISTHNIESIPERVEHVLKQLEEARRDADEWFTASLILMEQRNKLLVTGKALVNRWETPLWKDIPNTAGFIKALADAISAVEKNNTQ